MKAIEWYRDEGREVGRREDSGGVRVGFRKSVQQLIEYQSPSMRFARSFL